MTTWSIQYGDETGNQINRTTDDIGEVHATLEAIVKDEERTAGYAGQTATWRDYSGLIADGNVGNWTLDIVNLDTHTADGYTVEEAAEMQAEFYGGDVPMTDEDSRTEWTVLVTLEMFPDTKPVEWRDDAKGAQAHANQCVAILTDTDEPYPLRPTHESYRTVYEASGHHDVFGEWSVHLIATDV